MSEALYSYNLPGGGHWSLRVRRGLGLRLTDLEGGANLGMMFYNAENLLERYNAPDTLKCQHTFKLQRGHCLYSDMGRVMCSIVQDDLGWHDTVSGSSTAAQIAARWGARDYQDQRNRWQQNGFDSFLVELAKYGLNARDLGANLNLFSKVAADQEGAMHWVEQHSYPGAQVLLRFDMDCLVVMHACPHPLDTAQQYPRKPVQVELMQMPPVRDDDECKNSCSENQRGFENNRLYYMGAPL